MKKFAVLLFGLFCYATFVGVFIYAIGFLGNFGVPKTIDGPPQVPWRQAIGTNFLLISVFALQHSVMARPWFKSRWVLLIPEPIERSVYVLCTNLAFVLLFACWQPIGPTIWNLESPRLRTAMYGLFAVGWITVLVTTFLINHFDLFGLRQVWLYFRGRPYTPIGFATPGPYRIVRHPMYIGWMLAFWSTPTMTAAHFVFAAATTAYILAAIGFEERDLVHALGHDYAEYRKRVPMIIPRLTREMDPRASSVHNGITTVESFQDPITTTRSTTG